MHTKHCCYFSKSYLHMYYTFCYMIYLWYHELELKVNWNLHQWTVYNNWKQSYSFKCTCTQNNVTINKLSLQVLDEIASFFTTNLKCLHSHTHTHILFNQNCLKLVLCTVDMSHKTNHHDLVELNVTSSHLCGKHLIA